MTDPRPVLMMGWNQHWLTVLDELLPESSVVVVEEPDVYEGKRIAARWSGHPAVRGVILAGSAAYRSAITNAATPAMKPAPSPMVTGEVHA